jgi:hypothetical protein
MAMIIAILSMANAFVADALHEIRRYQMSTELLIPKTPFAWLCGEVQCEDLPLPLAYVGDKKVKRFHFSEIIGRLLYVRATCRVT